MRRMVLQLSTLHSRVRSGVLVKRLFAVTLFLVLTSILAGCPSSNTKAAPMAKVDGTVTLDGKPMGGGEVRFSLPGQPVKSLAIKEGAFSGEAYVGKNLVEVVWDKAVSSKSTDAAGGGTVNTISGEFWGPTSKLSADVTASGVSGLKFSVKSAR